MKRPRLPQYRNSQEEKDKIREIVESFRTKCLMCGTKDKSVLTFHHRKRKDKRFRIANAHRYHINHVIAELHKCDVYCRDCHDIIDDCQPKEKK